DVALGLANLLLGAADVEVRLHVFRVLRIAATTLIVEHLIRSQNREDSGNLCFLRLGHGNDSKRSLFLINDYLHGVSFVSNCSILKTTQKRNVSIDVLGSNLLRRR